MRATKLLNDSGDDMDNSISHQSLDMTGIFGKCDRRCWSHLRYGGNSVLARWK
jgi:hypothetical protein